MATSSRKVSLKWIIINALACSILLLTKTSDADPRTEIIDRICDTSHVQNLSNFFMCYSKVAEDMREEMYQNRFSMQQAGDPPERLYALAQCMEDLSNDECTMCFSQISTLIPDCFPHTGGRVYLDGCFMRVQNYSFFGEATGPKDMKKCSIHQDSSKEFKDAVVELLDIIVPLAASNTYRGYWANQGTTKHGVSAYGIATCWNSLDEASCSACLSEAALSALSCLPATGARILNSGCFLRYSSVAFANECDTRDNIFVYIVYLFTGLVLCVLAISIGVFFGKLIYKRINHPKSNATGEDVDLMLDVGLRYIQFKYSTLETATENFSEDCRLGRGGYGEVFKGTLKDGREIAVKRLFVSRKSQIKEIYNEMDIISTGQHKNLVRFLGCCFTSIDSILVYEYLANKSLDHVLFDSEKRKELDWKRRQLIIIGTAEGLEYLHKDCKVRVVHRDIKASNVLLDLKYKPKISDFGLARFYSCDQAFVNTAIAGTLGYMAPEYISNGRLTEKVDVYSFGVLVLEIVSGVKNNDYQPNADIPETLITGAWKHFKSNKVEEIFDKSLKEVEDENNIEQMRRAIQIGLLCTQESPSLRPSMTKVVQMLRNKDGNFQQLPAPSKPPFTDEHMELHSFSSHKHFLSDKFENIN